jgi:hypothetical protein
MNVRFKDEQLQMAIQFEAQRRHMSVSGLVQVLLNQSLSRIDEMLNQEWEDTAEVNYERPPKPHVSTIRTQPVPTQAPSSIHQMLAQAEERLKNNKG